MGFDLNGKKLLLCVNVIKYPGFKRDRDGTEADERNIINTFKVKLRIYLVIPCAQGSERNLCVESRIKCGSTPYKKA